MINEFAGRRFPCTEFVPPYGSDSDNSRVCTAVSGVSGQPYVDGTAYLDSAYNYQPSHKWRNVGILYVMMFGLMAVHLIAIEKISEKKSKGEVLVFQKGKAPGAVKASASDEEAGAPSEKTLAEKEQGARTTADIIQRQDSIFSWKDVCYDIKIKKDETRRILDNVDGWVRPGALTALMSVSGAGKTTLLDVLAERVTVGVITGGMLVDGRPRDSSFQRKIGYVQQQDIHLETSSVREALRFSALMRQPAGPREEKLAYVEEIIRLLDMEEYADATVGVPGEGLNVEQRKRLTIGVELAAKPQLLLFFDEPTSGLDSQTSWAICDLMEKLKNSGQAILCTIHQPSAMLFQRFDRLLFLGKCRKDMTCEYACPLTDRSKWRQNCVLWRYR
jgi:ABC-type multidrug transport system ATPase subunit